MTNIFVLIIDSFAPIFLVLSPITSYADQIISIHRQKSSDGFSLDIPLIMLVASILKFFYWFGARYDLALLVQACLMIVVQSVLLKVAVDNKPNSGVRDGLAHRPFADSHLAMHAQQQQKSGLHHLLHRVRPYNFWRWNTAKPYFQFLAYFAGLLLGVQVLLPPLAHSPAYVELLGYVGLAIEALLPIPQIVNNHNARSCKGFRLSVIANWLVGDTMKMSYFFLSTQNIPWPFRLCGMFQACCDVYLGVQFYMYGDGSGSLGGGLDLPEKMSTGEMHQPFG